MRKTVRRAITLVIGTGATLLAATGIAYADTGSSDGNSHHPNGTGSGLTGGPTQTQVLTGVPVPLHDPTLGEGTVLPLAYNTLAGLSG